MMENRSYDQMLGGLPGDAYAGPPPSTTLAYTGRDGVVGVPLRYGTPHDSFYPRQATSLSVTLNRLEPRTDASTLRTLSRHARSDATPEAITDFYATLVGS